MGNSFPFEDNPKEEREVVLSYPLGFSNSTIRIDRDTIDV